MSQDKASGTECPKCGGSGKIIIRDRDGNPTVERMCDDPAHRPPRPEMTRRPRDDGSYTPVTKE
jgi:hypothetical protein